MHDGFVEDVSLSEGTEDPNPVEDTGRSDSLFRPSRDGSNANPTRIQRTWSSLRLVPCVAQKGTERRNVAVRSEGRSMSFHAFRTFGSICLSKDARKRDRRGLSYRTTTRSTRIRCRRILLASATDGRLLGATALITGSTVGAGILALPASVVKAGFVPSSCVLGTCWMLLLFEAFLLAEVNVTLREELVSKDVDGIESKHGHGTGSGGTGKIVSLSQMAERTLGKTASDFVNYAYLFLSYTLLVAYLAKAGELIGDIASVSPEMAGVGFAAAMGTSIYVGSEQATDAVNRAFTGALLLLFLFITMFGFHQTDGDLSHLSYADWSEAPACFPIAFLALVYHDLVPVICAYLEGDRENIRKAILCGSTIPLGMFLLWNGAFLALAPPGTMIDPLDFLGGGEQVTGLLGVFGVLAIATSLIGTLVSMTEYIISHVRDDHKLLETTTERLCSMGVPCDSSTVLRAMAFLAVLVPPLTVAFTDPDIFLSASAFAGAYGMTSLYGIVPPFMALSLRKEKKKKGMATLVPGGSGVLVGLSLSAVLIAGGQARLDFSLP